MEKEFGSWFHNQHTDWRSPNLNSSCASFEQGQNTVPSYINPCTNTVSTNGNLPHGNLPVFAFSGAPHTKPSQPNEPRGWFYCLPRFRQAFSPVLNSFPRKELPAGLNENLTGTEASNAGSAQKRFLVFDQSRDQTTIIFSSGMGTPVQYLPPWNSRIPRGFDLNKEETGIKRETIHQTLPFLNDEYNEENQKDDVRSEMHEDTEELDALLYSDDDSDYDYSEDDEVTSTGHSPSTVTGYDKHEWSEECGEEVASSDGPTKRQKLLGGGYDAPTLVDTTLVDTASSVKTRRCLEYEDDDAESSCGERKNPVLGELNSLAGNKRSRKEKIRDTISILQSIIPSAKGGKDAMVALDEAIHYLRSLKAKAEALGLDTL